MKAAGLLPLARGRDRSQGRSKGDPAELMAFVDDAATQDAVSRVTTAFWPGARVEEGGLALALETLKAEPSPHLLIVDVSQNPEPLREIRRLRDLCEPTTLVIALGTVNDVKFFRDLLAEGVTDYLVKPLDPNALHRAILSALREPESETDPQKPTRTLAVVGVRGGVGATTVATTLGWLLAHEKGQRVTIVDLDLHFGTVGLALDLASTGGLRDALSNAARVDRLFVASALVAESERLSILACEEPLNADLPVHPAALDRLLRELRETADWIVLDLPRTLAVTEPVLLQAASDILIVSDLSMAGLRDMLRFVEMAENVAPSGTLRLVVNREGLAPKGQISAGVFEKTLGRALTARVPEDRNAVAAAVNAGKPLAAAAKGSKLLHALRSLASELAPAAETVRAKGLKRFFG